MSFLLLLCHFDMKERRTCHCIYRTVMQISLYEGNKALCQHTYQWYISFQAALHKQLSCNYICIVLCQNYLSVSPSISVKISMFVWLLHMIIPFNVRDKEQTLLLRAVKSPFRHVSLRHAHYIGCLFSAI